jgi:hypothetical protein
MASDPPGAGPRTAGRRGSGPGAAGSRTAGPRRLGPRTLNRALLARQLLLDRARMPVLAAVAHLVGLQAQAPTPPYYGLWSRLAGFDPAELGRLLRERQVVRAPLLRGTIHLVTADDCLPLRGLVQPVFDRLLTADPARAAGIAGMDLTALAAAGRELLAERPRTARALGPELAKRWPERDPAVLAWAVQLLLPLLQVPPRGVWGASGPAAWTPVESWLGTPAESRPGAAAESRPGAAAESRPGAAPDRLPPEQLVRRYLAGFGPATVADVQQWSGLAGLGEAVERMELRRFRDEPGRELYDLPDAPLPDPDTPAPARFVAPFDNLVLGHADRTRVISDPDRRRVFTVNGIVKGTVLVDGFVAGSWRLDQDRAGAVLSVEPFRRLPAADRAALAAEGARLLEFAAGSAASREVRFAPVPA